VACLWKHLMAWPQEAAAYRADISWLERGGAGDGGGGASARPAFVEDARFLEVSPRAAVVAGSVGPLSLSRWSFYVTFDGQYAL